MNIPVMFSSLALIAGIALSNCSSIKVDNMTISNGKESDASVKKTVEIGNFNRIEASQAIKVIYTQGPASGNASIATTPSAEKYLRIIVKDNTLRVYYDSSNMPKGGITGPSIITVTGPMLNEVDLSSAALFDVAGDLNQTGKLDIEASSASKFTAGKITCSSIDIETSSAAKVNIDAVNADMDVETSSASSVNISAIKANKISLEASSASKINVDGIVSNNLNAEASSTAKINLSGKTKNFIKDQSSAAKINHSNLRVD